MNKTQGFSQPWNREVGRLACELAPCSTYLHLPSDGITNFFYSGDFSHLCIMGVELILYFKGKDIQFMLTPQYSLILFCNTIKKKIENDPFILYRDAPVSEGTTLPICSWDALLCTLNFFPDVRILC